MKPLSEQNPAITYTFNILNMIQLRNHLAWLREKESNPKIGFNMGEYYEDHSIRRDMSKHHCATVACMAGHVALLTDEKSIHKLGFSFFDTAKNWLGLSWQEAEILFMGKFASSYNLDNVTLDQAIGALDYMIENGQIPPAIRKRD